MQSILVFVCIQFAMKQFMPQPPSEKADSSSADTAITSFADRPGQMDTDAQHNAIPQKIIPIWSVGEAVDMSIYVSPSVVIPNLKSMPKEAKVLDEKAFGFGDWKDKRQIHTTIKVPKEVQHNATLWAHFFVGLAGAQLDPTAADYDASRAYSFIRPFTQFLVKKKVRKARNLLSGTNQTAEDLEAVEDEPSGPTSANYYHENFTLSFIPEGTTHNYPSMHPAMRQYVNLERSGARDASGQNGWYYPIVFVNTFWQLRNHMVEVNETTTELPLNIWLDNTPFWKFSIFSSVDEGMKVNREKSARGESIPGGDGVEFEEFKRILLDSNPYLLGTTAVASCLHMLFEMLAFKNDVSHWRTKKDNIGTSFRTIIANVVMQLIIFLYLMDNNENTSWMILFSQGMGIAIEAWKITKTVNVRIRPAQQGSFIPYRIAFEDKHQLSETEKKTQEYDQIAFKYLYWVAVPLIGAYAVYSLIYDSHKSWYSFVITTLVGAVYAYGFLLMVPSLYINYRLKSVAHMPGKTMMYKFVNTFIDDLFAFTIKMPLLHRLATLRDDVIFFVYLYQSWKYKIDYSRVNEFGQGGADSENEDEVKKEGKPAASPEGDDSKAKAIDEIKATKATGAATTGKAQKRK